MLSLLSFMAKSDVSAAVKALQTLDLFFFFLLISFFFITIVVVMDNGI